MLTHLIALGLTLGAAKAAPPPSRSLETNVARAENAPAWITASRINRVADRMSNALEWDIRRIHLTFYADQAAFRRAHGYDDSVLGFTLKSSNSVSIGPKVTAANFDPVFAHELVHVILHQKYKGAVPGWLEEGLANYLAKYGKVDYAWLASMPERDFNSLIHPFGARGKVAPGGARYAYQASQALMEMIATRCDVKDLVTMSVGKKLENYLPTLCEIRDLNAEFRKWINRKAGRK